VYVSGVVVDVTVKVVADVTLVVLAAPSLGPS
jgi:hypothetical protein